MLGPLVGVGVQAVVDVNRSQLRAFTLVDCERCKKNYGVEPTAQCDA